MDPGLFTSGISGVYSKERDGSANIPDPNSANQTDPSKVTAEPLRISDLSAAEIKKKYYEIMAKGKSIPGKNSNKPAFTPKAIPAEADAVPSDSYKKNSCQQTAERETGRLWWDRFRPGAQFRMRQFF
jgi:hypothetical protein